MNARTPPTANQLLRSLPLSEYRRLSPALEPVSLTFGDVLCETGGEIKHVYFPNAGIISLLSPADDKALLEVGLIGREGMFGVPVTLGLSVSPARALVQGNGSAMRMRSAQFRSIVKLCSALQLALHQHTYSLLRQISQTAVCNTFHPTEARLARWLLTTGDRMCSDQFVHTQAFLAAMLGVQRPRVSAAASGLQRRRLISYSRGRVSILNRRKLEAAACSCYRATNRIYRAALR
ncbi:MAG TPA: Crp/Fnr family transcriptional regulator [Burkholderiaceae bacterium]|nr:Crp/Fnr family transcriptional regulator [Burkholderiaceae bacterium]